jgi:hypothetical protein
MLTYSQLARLERAARDSLVLNAYVDATELDSVSRRSWRHTLADGIVAQRKALAGAPHAERNAFDRAAARLDEATARMRDDLDGAPGWVAFVTADGFLHWGHTDTAPGTHLSWRMGIATPSYLRLMHDDGKVVVGVVNTREAEVYEWAGGDPERVARLEAHAHVGRAHHMGDSPREGFHAGTRGTALTDAARRALDVGRDQLLRDVVAELEGRGRPSGWIVVSGSRAMAREALEGLGVAARKRALHMDGLSGTSSLADVGRVAAAGRDQLRAAQERQRVSELIDRAVGRHRGVLGPEPTLEALRSGAARDVFASPAFFAQDSGNVEAVALAVLEHGAAIHEVTDAAAARLDGECHGVAATLRFAVGSRRRPSRAAANGA